MRLFRALLGVDKRTVIEDIEFEEDDAGDGARVIARVRPRSAVLRRCGRCGRK
ncbi:transposase for insertion sequence element IS1557 domain protein, partial [Mycobacterium tuberculosis variant bovis BCG]